MVAHNPLHRSGRADFPHPAPALGEDAHAAQRIVMVDANGREPAIDQPPHPVPSNSAVLTSPRQRALPEPASPEPEDVQRRCVHGRPVIAEMSTHHRTQPLPHFRDGSMHAPLNTRPARPPVHASAPPFRTAPQDSGPMWVANPSTYDCFIHYIMPVLTGARKDSYVRLPNPISRRRFAYHRGGALWARSPRERLGSPEMRNERV